MVCAKTGSSIRPWSDRGRSKLPNFFMVGGGKAGTSSLYFYMKEHPDIYMSPIKEPHYFADKELLADHIDVNSVVDSWDEYIRLFDGAQNERIRGEASATYLYYADPCLLKSCFPDAKILITLRDPAERAYSHYLMDVRAQLIDPYKLPFISAVKEMPMFTRIGFYYEHVRKYIEVFGKSDVKIILFDDLKRDSLTVVRDIFGFLRVDASFKPDVGVRYNTFAFPRNRMAFKLISNKGLKRMVKLLFPPEAADRIRAFSRRILMNSSRKPEMGEEARNFLRNLYRDDVRRLQDLVGRDLSHWLK